MTNGDMIRSLSNRELAHLLIDSGCPPEQKKDCPFVHDEFDCLDCWLAWLGKEVGTWISLLRPFPFG